MNHPSGKTVVCIGGPTASGKTALAISLAKAWETEIISADSRQCYRELHIGVARPAPEELAAVPHHFIATHSIQEPVTAATFEQYALGVLDRLFLKHEVVLVCGGTGLNLRALREGLDPMPSIPDEIRDQVRRQYATGGLAWLQNAVQSMDPLFFQTAEQTNPQRLMRALELLQATGKPMGEIRQGRQAARPFRMIHLAVDCPREVLYQRINRRVEKMMEAGLLEEVKGLLPHRHLNALQTVGYAELFDYLEGRCTLERAVEEIQKHTRHYAKRQLTWFRNEGVWQWVDGTKEQEIASLVRAQMNQA